MAAFRTQIDRSVRNLKSYSEINEADAGALDEFENELLRTLHDYSGTPSVQTERRGDKTLVVTYQRQSWMLRLRANSVNVKNGPLAVEISGPNMNTVAQSVGCLIIGYDTI